MNITLKKGWGVLFCHFFSWPICIFSVFWLNLHIIHSSWLHHLRRFSLPVVNGQLRDNYWESCFLRISSAWNKFLAVQFFLVGALLLLLLSRFSRVRLCATPETAAHQAPPSLGFSRQEHWKHYNLEIHFWLGVFIRQVYLFFTCA